MKQYKCIEHDAALIEGSRHGPRYDCPVEGCHQMVDYGHGHYMRSTSGVKEQA